MATDVGYIALLTELVVVPTAAVAAAVIDRMIRKRRETVVREPPSPQNAFPVVPIPARPAIPVDRGEMLG